MFIRDCACALVTLLPSSLFHLSLSSFVFFLSCSTPTSPYPISSTKASHVLKTFPPVLSMSSVSVPPLLLCVRVPLSFRRLLFPASSPLCSGAASPAFCIVLAARTSFPLANALLDDRVGDLYTHAAFWLCLFF